MTDALTARRVSVSPRILEAARLGRELRSIALEDAITLMPADDAVASIRAAFLKAYPKDRAEFLLSQIGREI